MKATVAIFTRFGGISWFHIDVGFPLSAHLTKETKEANAVFLRPPPVPEGAAPNVDTNASKINIDEVKVPMSTVLKPVVVIAEVIWKNAIIPSLNVDRPGARLSKAKKMIEPTIKNVKVMKRITLVVKDRESFCPVHFL